MSAQSPDQRRDLAVLSEDDLVDVADGLLGWPADDGELAQRRVARTRQPARPVCTHRGAICYESSRVGVNSGEIYSATQRAWDRPESGLRVLGNVATALTPPGGAEHRVLRVRSTLPDSLGS